MPARAVLASCAVALALVAFGACGGAQTSGAVASGSLDGGRDASRDAPTPPLFGGACPEDAPWTGTVCLGQGYVACPGGYSMDDRSRCLRDVATATTAAAPDAAAAADDPDE